MYYVDPTIGNDAAAGNQSAPFKTITHALEQAGSGDGRIQLASGTYNAASGERFPLVIPAGILLIGNKDNKGSDILIEGGSTYGNLYNITILINKDNVRLRGVTVTNRNPRGTGVWIGSPIPITASVANCTFTNCDLEGVFITDGVSPKILNNDFHENEGYGISITADAKGEIRGNSLQENGYGINVQKQAAPVITENIIRLNTRSGIVISGTSHPILRNNKIEQNCEDGLVVIENAQPDLGTSQSLGGNWLRGNCHYDLQSTSTNALLFVGNLIDPLRVKGNVDIQNNQVPDPLPCPLDRPFDATGISIPLRELSQDVYIEKIFGNELSRRLASLSRFDPRTGTLPDRQRTNIHTIASIINETAKKQLNTNIEFVSGDGLEKAIMYGDPTTLVASTAQSLSQWKKTLSPDLIKAIERDQLESFYKMPITSSQLGTSRETLITAGGEDRWWEEGEKSWWEREGWTTVAIALAYVAGYFVIKGLFDFINLILDGLCGPNLEDHRYPMPGGIIIETQTYLKVPWRGVVWGKNNQHFDAQYIVSVAGGVVDELRVNFEMRFEGGGFDKLVYPIEPAVWTLESGNQRIDDIQLRPIVTTRYHQAHECILKNVGFFVIHVINGIVYYGGDGCMTGAGLIPHVTAVKGGFSYTFPAGESVWKYGISF
jgi:parallel beta-helix repeat protein